MPGLTRPGSEGLSPAALLSMLFVMLTMVMLFSARRPAGILLTTTQLYNSIRTHPPSCFRLYTSRLPLVADRSLEKPRPDGPSDRDDPPPGGVQ